MIGGAGQSCRTSRCIQCRGLTARVRDAGAKHETILCFSNAKEQLWRGESTDVCNALPYAFQRGANDHSRFTEQPARTSAPQQGQGRLWRIPKELGRLLDLAS